MSDQPDPTPVHNPMLVNNKTGVATPLVQDPELQAIHDAYADMRVEAMRHYHDEMKRVESDYQRALVKYARERQNEAQE